jgi:hypothetical protein
MKRPHSMLDFILLILVAILVKYTFQSIGGFIRWIVFRKKSLKSYVKDEREGNLATFILTVALVAIITILVTV